MHADACINGITEDGIDILANAVTESCTVVNADAVAGTVNAVPRSKG